MNSIIRRKSSCADLQKTRKIMKHLHLKQKSLDETTSYERYRRLSFEATVSTNQPSLVVDKTRTDQLAEGGKQSQDGATDQSCSEEEDGFLERHGSVLRRRLSEESILVETRRERMSDRKLKTMSAIEPYMVSREREPQISTMGRIVEKIVEKIETITQSTDTESSDAQRSKSLTQIDCLENQKMGHSESVSGQGGSKSDPSPEDTSPSSLTTQSSTTGHLVVPSSYTHHLTSAEVETQKRLSAKPIQNQNQRTRRGALMVSEEDCSEESCSLSLSQDSSAIKQLRARSAHTRKSGGIFSNPFKTDKEKMEQLTEFLNYYSANGIPERNILSLPKEKLDELYFLEESWQMIVTNAEELPKRMQNQQDAIWELLQTEISYIKMLRVICDLFLSCLCNLQTECLLNDIDTEKMFSNITEVYGANHQFWVDYLLPMLNETRSTHLPLNPVLMTEGFLKVDEILHPYIKYCLEHSNCLHYVKKKRKESELFKAYIVWCETRKDCDRLRLLDLLVKPMQRLTKYSLLLKAIVKKTDAEEQKAALKQMNHAMERFVYRVDATLRRRHEQDKLASIASRIESYDVLESNNDEVEKLLREYSSLDLTCPMIGCQSQQIRQLLLEGSGLKLRDSHVSGKVDVHCFLFTDLLLLCKPVGKKSGDKVRVIRPPYLIDRTIVQELKDSTGFIVLYLNEFNVATNAFTLHTADSKTWIDFIRKAQQKYKEAKQSAFLSAQVSQYSERSFDEEDDSEIPLHAFLQATHSSLRSSRSSLVQSASGSTEISDTSAHGSMALIGPPSTPNNYYLSQPEANQQHPSRAVSFELGELRNPSMTVDDLDAFGRSQSMETRVPISVTVTSPRPERRAFLLRGAGAGSTGASPISTNTLSVSVPYHVSKHFHSSSDPPSIQVPVIHSNVKTLQRSLQTTSKPPLIKTKNVATPSVTVQSAPPSDGPTSPVHSFESEPGSESGVSDEQESLKGRLSQKRVNRGERRYHTADSIENMKKDRDTSIHKRLSWNLGGKHASHSGSSSNAGSANNSNKQLCNKHLIKCLSSDSVYTSSGFSSTESVTLSIGSDQYAMDLLGHIQEMEHVPEEKESNIKIDVSEVKDGISSVHITVNGSSRTKPSKTDLKKMKELLLTSLEASEV